MPLLPERQGCYWHRPGDVSLAVGPTPQGWRERKPHSWSWVDAFFVWRFTFNTESGAGENFWWVFLCLLAPFGGSELDPGSGGGDPSSEQPGHTGPPIPPAAQVGWP